MKFIKDLPIHDRPREKLLTQGASFLSDQELLAVILGKGTQKDDVLALSKKIVKIIDEKGLSFTAHDITNILLISVSGFDFEFLIFLYYLFSNFNTLSGKVCALY